MFNLGSIPSSLCSATALNDLRVSSLSTNTQMFCSPACLTTVNTLEVPAICTTFQDDALCGVVAATEVWSYYTDWVCNIHGLPTVNPCGNGTAWNGLSCDGGYVVSIDFGGLEVAGMSVRLLTHCALLILV